MDSYEECEKCRKGFYVPEKSINTGEIWFFCNCCFKYKEEFQKIVDKELGREPNKSKEKQEFLYSLFDSF